VFVSFALAQKDYNRTIFQSSPITALLNGVMNDSITVGEIIKHGDFGLGTFNGVDGEMIVLNGKVYRVDYHGKVTTPDNTRKTPFVSVLFFHADTTFILKDTLNFRKFTEYLDKNLSSLNFIYAFKISGTYNYIETRSEEKQTKAYTNLADVLKNQSVFKFENLDGTLVGFRFPVYMQGVNVPGYHFHFISKDEQSGGHVLDFVTGKVTVEVEKIYNFEMNFPSTKEFIDVNLEKKPTPGL
jgi:acetolactate decarboxylase